MVEKGDGNKGLQILDKIYGYALNGLPNQKSVVELGDEYINKYNDLNIAAEKFINNQIAKCTTSGFLTVTRHIIPAYKSQINLT